MTRLPFAFWVPPIRRSPGPLLTGSDSPVRSDSSTLEWPSSTSPSTGTLSPGRTRSRSPACTASSGISSSLSSARRRRAVGGARRSKALIAAEVEERARSSRIWPEQRQRDDHCRGFEVHADPAVLVERRRKQTGGPASRRRCRGTRRRRPCRSASTCWDCGSRSTAPSARRTARPPRRRRASSARAPPSCVGPPSAGPCGARASRVPARST